MKLLYEAANSVEAHMIVNLLEQSELTARIDGAFLQGGAGDLQAFGVVRVMIDQEDYNKAEKVINLWEAMAPSIDEIPKNVESSVQIKEAKFKYLMLGFVIGFVCAITITIFANT